MKSTADSVTYRAYRPEDVQAVRRLDAKVMEELGFPAEEAYCGWHADLGEVQKAYLESGGFWVAEAGGEVVGMLGAAALDDETAGLRRLRVDPAWRRRGIAGRLCEMAEEFCRERGFARLQLHTEARMEAARRLYEKRGYRLELTDRHEEYEACWYVKDLSAGSLAASWQEALRRASRHLGLLRRSWQMGSLPGELSDEQVRLFERYLELLLARNQQTNLTAITEPREVAIKHFYDSLTCLAAIEAPEGAELIDVGSGAGFPGAVLALLRPDLEVTLLDSTRKATAFLEELLGDLALGNARVIRGRAEELSRRAETRGRWDFAVTRAAGGLLEVAKWSRGLLREGGELVLMKGPRGEEEMARGMTRLLRLGLEFSHVLTLRLPEGAGERKLIVLRRPVKGQKPRSGTLPGS
jgi:16S rRNA (guanine527-N7)-methyltransferase